MNKKRLSIIWAALVLAMTSCIKEAPQQLQSQGQVSVIFDLFQADTKADAAAPQATAVSVDDFKVEILNADRQVIKRWATFADCKNEGAILLNSGEYYAKATYGDSTKTGFDVRAFAGETQFTLAPQAIEQHVGIVCRPSNVKVSVEFGHNIVTDYTDVIADVYNSRTSKSKLHFDPQTADAPGYVPAGNLVLSLETTNDEGSKGYFKDYSVTAQAGEHVTYRVETKELPGGSAVFELSIVSETIDTTITLDLLSSWVSPKAPTIKFEGANNQTVVEGMDANDARIDVSAQASLTSLVLKIEKSAYLINKGFEEETELLAVNDYTDLGLKVKGITTAKSIYLEEFISSFEAVAGDNENILTFIATDGKGRQVSQSVTFTIGAPEFSFTAPQAGDVFTKKATAAYSLTKGNPDLLKVEISKDGTKWTALSLKGGKAFAQNLQPSTTYSIRARYNNHTVPSAQFTTEAEAQLPNSGFEDFYRKSISYRAWTSNYTRYEYYPYKEGASDAEKCWFTNNALTCFNPGTPQYQAGKTFACVNYLTAQYGAYEGNYSAEMRNVTLGSGSNALGIGATDIVMTCGKLFLATFTSGGAIEGRAFASRPTALEFYFKYNPLKIADADNIKRNYQDDEEEEACEAFLELFSGDIKIAHGKWTCQDKVEQWTKVRLDIEYLKTSLKATSMKLIFKSSIFPDAFSAQPSHQAPPYKSNVKVTVNGESFTSSNTGSVFDVDNLTLIYEN